MPHCPPPSPAGRASDSLLDPQLLDRVAGVLVAQACGDALGVPYRFAPAPPRGTELRMLGGGDGTYGPAEWTDNTQVAVCVAQVAAQRDIAAGGPEAIDAIARALDQWQRESWDMSRQPAAILRAASLLHASPADRIRIAHSSVGSVPGLTAGNGALLRAGVMGLIALHDRIATAEATRHVAALTHQDEIATDACVLWSEAVRLAASEHHLDLSSGLDLLPAPRRVDWLGWITDAESRRPTAGLHANGFSVTALQAAWHAIYITCSAHPDPVSHLVEGLSHVIRLGGYTDRTASMTGALLGAYHGLDAVPISWRETIHGGPGMGARELGGLTRRIVQRTVNRESTGECPRCGTVTPGDVPLRESTTMPLCQWCA